MKFGARNVIDGKVVSLKKGNIMGQVTVEIPGGQRISSVMTVDSMEELNLKEDDSVQVIVKAINVLLAKEK